MNKTTKRRRRFVMPYQITTKDGNFWCAVIDGETVKVAQAPGSYQALVDRVTTARKAARRGNTPPREGRWIAADMHGGWTCCVEQGRYGHYARKPTLLYAVGCELPELSWGKSEARLDPAVVARMGLKRGGRSGSAKSANWRDWDIWLLISPGQLLATAIGLLVFFAWAGMP